MKIPNAAYVRTPASPGGRGSDTVVALLPALRLERSLSRGADERREREEREDDDRGAAEPRAVDAESEGGDRHERHVPADERHANAPPAPRVPCVRVRLHRRDAALRRQITPAERRLHLRPRDVR